MGVEYSNRNTNVRPCRVQNFVEATPAAAAPGANATGTAPLVGGPFVVDNFAQGPCNSSASARTIGKANFSLACVAGRAPIQLTIPSIANGTPNDTVLCAATSGDCSGSVSFKGDQSLACCTPHDGFELSGRGIRVKVCGNSAPL